MPSYTNSIRTMTPRQAYRRVRRVIQLQWRGIVIVLVIIADVIFFAIIFVFLDTTVQSIKTDPQKALAWAACLVGARGDKNKCLDLANKLVVNLPTVTAVLVLLAVSTYQCSVSIILNKLTSNIDEWHLVAFTTWPLVNVHRLGRVIFFSPWYSDQKGIRVGGCSDRTEAGSSVL